MSDGGDEPGTGVEDIPLFYAAVTKLSNMVNYTLPKELGGANERQY